jgi:hypothetical protein
MLLAEQALVGLRLRGQQVQAAVTVFADEARRRAEAGLGAVDSRALLTVLYDLPVGLPVPLASLDAYASRVLQRVVGRPLRRVGLSATVGNPDELLLWLQGSGAGKQPSAVVVPHLGASGPGAPGGLSSPPIDLQLDYVGSADNAATVIAALHRGEKRLVFCESRRLEVVVPAQQFNDCWIRLREDLTPGLWKQLSTAGRDQLCLPEVDERAVKGLKFADALLPRLAESTLARRLADLESAARVLAEPVRFVSR